MTIGAMKLPSYRSWLATILLCNRGSPSTPVGYRKNSTF